MLLFALFIKSPEQLFRLLRPFIITGVVIGALSAIVHYGLGYRSFGFTGGPNEYAVLNVEAVPVCVVMALRSRDLWRWFYWLAIPVFFIATLAAGSRSGLIAMMVVGVFCCAGRVGMTLGQRARWAALAAVIGIMAFLLAGILDPTRFSLAGYASDRGGGRLDIWTAAILGLRTHWLVGYGIGGFQKHALELIQKATGASLDVARNSDFKDGNNIPAHSLFFAVVLDLGVIGVVLYFGAMLVAIKNLYDMLKTEWRELAWIGLGVFVAVIASGPFASSLNPKLQWAFTGLPGAYYVRRNLTNRSRRKAENLTGSLAHGDH
jgi:O-antigen ligase